MWCRLCCGSSTTPTAMFDGRSSSGYLAGQDPAADHPAVRALARRLADEDPGVRDWAAFGIGCTGVDTPEIRAALRRLLERPEEDAAGEAAVALAKLKDPSVLPELLGQLARDDV